MALTVTQSPYEFLARFNRDGSLAGAHVKLLTSVIDSTKVQAPQYIEGDAQPVATVVGGIGFPIADVISALQVATLTTMQDNTAQYAADVAKLNADAKIASDTAAAELAAAQVHYNTLYEASLAQANELRIYKETFGVIAA